MSNASPRLGTRATARATSARLASVGAASARDVGLRLVAPVRRRAARVPFVVIMIGVIAAGLTGLVLLSTVLQAQAFRISDLNRQHGTLLMEKQQIAEQVDQLQSPGSVAQKATDLGMVPQQSPAFLRLSDGAILGQPEPAGAGR